MIKTGAWKLSDLDKIPSNNLKVFSFFHCGGGSTMGYKLAGCTVLGGVEIDKKMMSVYRLNHDPKYSYLMDIREFNALENATLPDELFNLDILDGSPPCSSFSMSGNRSIDWNKKKQFREGQATQVLDDLFFEFIKTANKLKPKIVIAENVVGLLQGPARGYVKEIVREFRLIGYEPQIFRLDASLMGVPQKRERVFFIARRIDLDLPRIKLNFNEPIITLQQAFNDIDYDKEVKKPATEFKTSLWHLCEVGKNMASVNNGNSFNYAKLNGFKPACTLTAHDNYYHWQEPRHFTKTEICRIQSFPDDYNFINEKPVYICGMSVPPFMMQRIVLSLIEQFGWGSVI